VPIAAISRQFLVFAFVGAIGTGAHFTVLAALVETSTASATLASACGFVVGALVNYGLNFHITFSHARGHLEAAPRFAAVAAVGAMLNIAIMYVLTESAGWYYLVCQIVATGAVLIVGFLLNRFWTFGREVTRSQ
jgi:putative flippase GtrA